MTDRVSYVFENVEGTSTFTLLLFLRSLDLDSVVYPFSYIFTCSHFLFYVLPLFYCFSPPPPPPFFYSDNGIPRSILTTFVYKFQKQTVIIRSVSDMFQKRPPFSSGIKSDVGDTLIKRRFCLIIFFKKKEFTFLRLQTEN